MALRFLLARILAPRRAPPIDFELPPLDTQQDLAQAMAAVGQAAADGEITPGDAADFARVVDTAMRTIQAREVEYHNNRVAGRQRSPSAPPPPDPAPPAPPPPREPFDAVERPPGELDRRSRASGNLGASDAAQALAPPLARERRQRRNAVGRSPRWRPRARHRPGPAAPPRRPSLPASADPTA